MFDFLFGWKKTKTPAKEEELNVPVDSPSLPLSTQPTDAAKDVASVLPTLKKSKGVFTSYKLEYLYDLIGEEKIQNKLKELEGKATMGVSFRDFVTRESRFSAGDVWVLGVIVDSFFPDDAEVAKLVYDSSKKYSGQWCSLHFLYASIINVFYEEKRKAEQLSLKVEGAYVVAKKLLSNDLISLELRKRRAPGVGHYLFYRSSSDRKEIWHLEPASEDNCWSFKKVNEVFSLQIISDRAVIKKIETLMSTNSAMSVDELDSIVDEMIDFYIAHFSEISHAMKDDIGAEVANAFVWEIMDYYKNGTKKWKGLVTMNNRYSSAWRKIDL
jgi:hypothetical protein